MDPTAAPRLSHGPCWETTVPLFAFPSLNFERRQRVYFLLNPSVFSRRLPKMTLYTSPNVFRCLPSLTRSQPLVQYVVFAAMRGQFDIVYPSSLCPVLYFLSKDEVHGPDHRHDIRPSLQMQCQDCVHPLRSDNFVKKPSSSGLGPETGPGIFQLGQPTQIM